jgi:hypothetical protein
MAETTPPSEGKPEPEALPPGVSSHTVLNGNPSIRYIGRGAASHIQDTPHPARAEADAAILSNWWDAPQPLQPPRRSVPFDPGGPAEPPFTPQTTRVVADSGVGIENTVRVGAAAAAGVGVAQGGEAPDIAQFVGHVTFRTVIIRTVLNNRVAVQLTALSLLAALDLKIETLRASGSNSEITAFDDLKRRVEEFLAANEKGEETAIADTTLSIADGLRRYWTEAYDKVCDTGLLGVGLSFCAVAGAFGVGETTILTVTALAGGQRVVDVVKAAADLVWGKGDKS